DVDADQPLASSSSVGERAQKAGAVASIILAVVNTHDRPQSRVLLFTMSPRRTRGGNKGLVQNGDWPGLALYFTVPVPILQQILKNWRGGLTRHFANDVGNEDRSASARVQDHLAGPAQSK